VVILAAAGLLGYAFLTRGDGGGRGPQPPAAEVPDALPPGELARLRDAPDLLAPDVYRRLHAEHVSPAARDELSRALKERSATAAVNLDREVEGLLARFRYASAAALTDRYATAWLGTEAARRAAELRDELGAEQEAQVEGRREEALALVEEGRYDAARSALQTSWELEDRYRAQLAAELETLERLIRVRQHEALPRPPIETPDAGGRPTLRAEPSPPPPLPGAPHADVKRLAEARDLLAQARRAFAERRFQQAMDDLGNVVGYYGDLRYVSRRRDGIGALEALARHGLKGLSGLFHAAQLKRDGRRIRLAYDFADEAQMLDWEQTQIFPNQRGGEFREARGGVRGTGTAVLLLRAFFENNVTISCQAKNQEAKSHGLVLCQEGLETRFLMWMVANHYFVEGENYVKVRPGHSILMFGKGVNADVPVDSPDIGFIFRGPSITKPELRDGMEAKLSFSLREDTMTGTIATREGDGQRSGSTVGDDGRSIERTRPGLFVIETGVIFSDIVVEGRLHQGFEDRRVSALLDIAATLDGD